MVSHKEYDLDGMLEREEISEEEYYVAYGERGRQAQISFWIEFWQRPVRIPEEEVPFGAFWKLIEVGPAEG
jgi:hypothetical protein